MLQTINRLAPRFIPTAVYKPFNPVFILFNPVGTGTIHLTKNSLSKAKEEVLSADQNNDMIKAVDKVSDITRSTVSTTKSCVDKLKKGYRKLRKSSLHKAENKLKSKNDLLRKHKQTIIKNQQRPLKSTSKKVKSTVKNLTKEFIKFVFRCLSCLFAIIIVVVLLFQVLLVIFSNIGKSSTPILATYNAKDIDISIAEEEYTKIAYEFNQQIIKCGTSDWKNSLNSLGVNTSSYHTRPSYYYFGQSERFSEIPVYDYDPDKFSAFLCAYFTERNSEGDVKNWQWQNSYKSVLQTLFDTEYTFQHRYEDYSGWVEKSSYTFLGGGGTNSSYYTVKSNISRNEMEINAIPSEIYAFSRDNKIHYDINTLEILNANDYDKKTGWFIQDQRYFVSDPNGHNVAPFYTQIVNPSGAFHHWGWQHGTNADGSIHYENRGSWYWTDNHQEIFYLVNPTDTHKWNSGLNEICLISFYQKYEWRTDCSLYYTVKQNCTFEEAIKTVLNSKDNIIENQRTRLSFYNILTQANENGRQTYGNHQKMNAPVLSKSLQRLIDNNKILNHYGYDMQKWNENHCSGLTESHKGMDIIANNDSDVYAMFDGYISNIDTFNQTLTLDTTTPQNFWYENLNDDDEKQHKIKCIYSNIQSTVHQGDTITAGQIIGKVTTKRHCYSNLNSMALGNYLHITIKIQYGYEEDRFWKEVDPRLLIYRNDGETH